MITIDLYDGNRFLVRQARQLGRRSKTRLTATFVPQFVWKPTNSRNMAETFAQHWQVIDKINGIRECRQVRQKSRTRFRQLLRHAAISPDIRD